MDAGMAGSWTSLITFVGTCVAWVGTYVYRVATKVRQRHVPRRSSARHVAVSACCLRFFTVLYPSSALALPQRMAAKSWQRQAPLCRHTSLCSDNLLIAVLYGFAPVLCARSATTRWRQGGARTHTQGT